METHSESLKQYLPTQAKADEKQQRLKPEVKQRDIKTFDQILEFLSTEINIDSGSNIYQDEQSALLSKQFQNNREQMLENQIIMQCLMDLRGKIPLKLYNEVIQKIATGQNGRSDAKGGLMDLKQEQDKEHAAKVKSQIEYEVIPEIEQYLHGMSKVANSIISKSNPDDDENTTLTQRYQKMKSETQSLKEKIAIIKSDKQEVGWGIRDTDIQIKDYIDKIGRGYVLNSLSTFQKDQVQSLSTQMAQTELKEQAIKSEFDDQFDNQQQSQAQQAVRQILEKRVEDLVVKKHQLHSSMIKYAQNEDDFKAIAQEVQALMIKNQDLDRELADF